MTTNYRYPLYKFIVTSNRYGNMSKQLEKKWRADTFGVPLPFHRFLSTVRLQVAYKKGGGLRGAYGIEDEHLVKEMHRFVCGLWWKRVESGHRGRLSRTPHHVLPGRFTSARHVLQIRRTQQVRNQFQLEKENNDNVMYGFHCAISREHPWQASDKKPRRTAS